MMGSRKTSCDGLANKNDSVLIATTFSLSLKFPNLFDQATENSTSNSDDRQFSYRKKLLSTQSEPSVGSIHENVDVTLKNSAAQNGAKNIFKSVEK